MFCLLRARCVGVGVFLPSSFAFPLLASRLSNSHLIFMLISPSSFFTLTFISSGELTPCFARCVCVCVERLNRRKTSRRIFIYINILILMQGVTGVPGGRWPMKTPAGARVNVPAWCTWMATYSVGAIAGGLYIYIYTHTCPCCMFGDSVPNWSDDGSFLV